MVTDDHQRLMVLRNKAPQWNDRMLHIKVDLHVLQWFPDHSLFVSQNLKPMF